MRNTIFGLILLLILSGCGKVNDIKITGVSDVTFRGLKQNVVLLTLNIEIDNPNTRKISITEVNFKAWLNERDFGTLSTSGVIALKPCSRSKYPVDVEIKLRTVADAFKLMGGNFEEILKRIEVEGYIKGKSFPVRKKVVVKRQPFSELAKSL